VDPTLSQLLRLLRPHPWHGVSRGEDAPRRVHAYVEIVPTDTIKYELDKATGLLKVDRPQQLSSLCPTLYGFIPQTWCGPATGALAARATGRPVERGDGDPLDLCVLTEKSVPRGDLLLTAIPVGGLRLIDRGEADDKIVAVLEGDAVYGHCVDLSEVPAGLVDRLRHYFLTYKRRPGEAASIEIADVYGRDGAWEVIEAAGRDYDHAFAELKALWAGAAPR
jgi:inorganic pyrophosphatase